MRLAQRKPSLRKQRGAVVIEMALVFSLFFGVCWAALGYAIPFFLYQSMNHAAVQAARTAVRADPDLGEAAYNAKLKELADATLPAHFSWLPANAQQALTTTTKVETKNGVKMLVVNLTFANYNQHAIVPVITLPLIGSIPNIPGDLTAESRYRIQ